MAKLIAGVLSLFLGTAVLTAGSLVWAADEFALIVKQGAFLLHPHENLTIKGRKTHGLKTYLPIGTVAVTSGQTKLLKNRKKQKKLYYEILTDTGLTGLLRSDLFKRLEPGQWLIANTDETIFVKNRANERIRSSFSKGEGEYVRVTRTPTAADNHYLVTLPWAIGANGNEDPGRVDAEFVTEGSAAYVDTRYLSRFKKATPQIKPVVSLSDNVDRKAKTLLDKTLGWVRGKVKSMAGPGVLADIGKIDAYLDNVVAHECGANLDGSAALGVPLKAANFKIGTKLTFKEAGHEYFFQAFQPQGFLSDLGGQFVVFMDVTCDGSLRNRLNTMIIEGEKVSGLDLQLKYFPPELVEEWDTNFQSEVFRSKMMRVIGSKQYLDLSDYLQSQAKEGTWLASLLGNEQKAVIAQLIPMIASIEK